MDTSPTNQRFVTRRLPVPTGLHVLRYVSAADPKRPPLVIVAPKPDEAAGLELVYSPGTPHDVLARVGDCVVIRARQPAAVLVTTASQIATRSDEVELRVERLDKSHDEAPSTAPASAVAGPAAVQANPHADIFEVRGHVQRRGDCAAGPDGWLGTSGGVARIEAFGVAWQRPAPGLRLHYGCRAEDGSEHVAKLPGQLVGSRGLALGITEIRFELGGKRSGEFELVVTASFQGGSVRTVAGRNIAMSGPTGTERLTGVKVLLREATLALPAAGAPAAKPALPPSRATAIVQAQGRTVAQAPAPATVVPPPVSGRAAAERPKIRVFRAARPSA